MRILMFAASAAILWNAPVLAQVDVFDGNTLPGPSGNPSAVASWQGDLYYATQRDGVTHYGLSSASLPEFDFATVFDVRDCGSELLILASERFDPVFPDDERWELFACRWDGTTLTKTGRYHDQNSEIGTAGPGVIYQGTIFTGGFGTDSIFGSRLRYHDGADWHPISVDDDVRALEIIDGDLYAVGGFTMVDGVAVQSVARFDGSTWKPFGSGLPGTAETIAWTGSEYYSTTPTGLWRWQSHNGTWIEVASAAGGSIKDAAASDGDLILVGTFTAMGGTPADCVARYDGSFFHAVPAGPNGPIDTVSSHGAGFVVEGAFLGTATDPANYAAIYDGSAWTPARAGGLGLIPDVNTFTTFGGDLLVSSYFSSIDAPSTTAAFGVARLTPSGWTGLAGGLHGGDVSKLVEHDGILYVFGEFQTTGGAHGWPSVDLSGWATWDGSQWAAWTPPPVGPSGQNIYLGVQDGDVVVGGSTYDFGQSELMARWDGTNWSSFPAESPLTGGFVRDVIEFEGNLHVAGSTMWVSSLPGDHDALYWDGAQWNETSISYRASRFFVWNGELYVTGRYTWRWTGSDWTNAPHIHPDGGDIYVSGGELYSTAWDTDGEGNSFGQLFRWSDGTGWVQIVEMTKVDEFGNQSSGSIGDMITLGETTYVVGSFTHLNGVRCDNFGAFTGEVVVSVEPQIPNRKLAIRAFPNPANPGVTLALESGQEGPVWLEVYDLRGRLVRTMVAGESRMGGSSVVWDGMSDSGVPAASGVYFARVRDGGGSATAKFTLVK